MGLSIVRVLGDGRFRHAETVTHITAFSDGKRILTSARDGTARIWDLESGRELKRFYHADGEDIWNAVLIPGERQVLTCGESKTVVRWDIESGKALASYQHEGDVFRLAMRPGTQQFVATDRKKSIVIWFWETGNRLLALKAHREAVYCAAVSPDGQTLATCGDDNQVLLWDLPRGERLIRLTGHGDDVYTVAFSPDGTRLLSCSEDKTARVWDVASGKEIWSTPLDGDVTVGAWSPDGKHVAVTCQDKHVHVLDATTGKPVRKMPVPGAVPWPVAYSHDGKTILAGSGPAVYRWEAATGSPLFESGGPGLADQAVDALEPARDGSRLYAAGGRDIHVWDGPELRPIARWPMPADVLSLALSRDAKRLLVALEGGRVLLLDAASGKIQSEVKHERVAGASWARDGRAMVTFSQNYSPDEKDVALWGADGSRQGSLRHGSDRVAHVAVSRDGERIVTAGEDGAVRVWSFINPTVLKQLAGCAQGMSHCGILSDDRSVVAIGRDNKLYHWAAPAPTHPADSAPAEIDRLIRQLAAAEFDEREKAVCELVRIGDPVIERLALADTSDLEVGRRADQIRRALAQARLPSILMGKPLALDRPVHALAVAPRGDHWAVVVGHDAAAEIVLGSFTPDGPKILSRTADGRSPCRLVFSTDARTLYAGNRDATVSVMRVR